MAGPAARHADNLAYCSEQLRTGAPDLVLSAQFAEPAQRATLLALRAFGLEIHKIPATVSEPPLGAIRQQWWRDALDEVIAGNTVRAHPVVEALAEAPGRAALHRVRPQLEASIEGVGWFLDGEQLSSPGHALDLARQIHGSLAEAIARTVAPEVEEGIIAAIGRLEAAATLARLTGPQGAGERARSHAGLVATFSERLQELRERGDGGANAAGAQAGAAIDEPVLAAIATEFEAARAAAGRLPAALMPVIAHASLTPSHLRAAARLRRHGQYTAGAFSELSRKWRLTRAVLSGRI